MLVDTETETVETAVLRALASHSTELLVLVRPDGITQGQLSLGAFPLGYPPEQHYTNRHVAQHVHPDDLADVLALLEQVRQHRVGEASVRVRARHYDGHWCLLDVDVIDRSSDSVLGGIVLRVRLAEDAGGPADTANNADGEDDRFRSLAEVVPSGILSADRRGYVVYANHEATRLMGLPPDRLYGQGWKVVIEAEDRPNVAAAAGAVVTHSDRERVMFRAHVRSETRWISAAFVPLGAPGGRTGWIAALDDVTDRRTAEIRLAHQATHDPLTGLPNRILLDDRLSQAIARLERDPHPLAVLYIDLDDFKPVNDRLGHAVGDQVLIEMSRRLRAITRSADTVARLGGDEFAVMCEQTDLDEAGQLAGRISQILAEPLLVAGGTVTVGASVGVIVTSTADRAPDTLLARADQEMYRAKRAGGGTMSIAG